MKGLVEVGTLKLGNLPNVWQALDLLEDDVDRANDRSTAQMDFTSRKFDEANRTGQRAYIQALHFIKSARDNQKALEALLRIRASPHAPWNLIRPAFESSFYAVWILEPEDSRVRKRRALRIAWSEQRQHRNRHKLMVELAHAAGHPSVLKAEEQDRLIKRRYEEEAHAVGMGTKELGQEPNMTDEIPKLTSLVAGEPKFHLLKWRELSGIQHSDMGAMLKLSDKTYKLRIPGGYTATLALNDDDFVATCYSAAVMQMTAMRLYIRRSTETPSKQV